MAHNVSKEQIETAKHTDLYTFLAVRGIIAETIRMLIRQNIMYQEKKNNNIIFINAEKDFAELRGTYTFGNPFHGIVPCCRHDDFWWFRTSGDAYYSSIAGTAKQPAIDRLKHSKLHVVLAVDNDDAGQKCRNKNSDLEAIIPENKDWNEDLQVLKAGYYFPYIQSCIPRIILFS